MAKFYVQCGTTELVLSSDSPESAALSMIDRILAPHLWIYDDLDLCDQDRLEHLMLEALLHLPTEIRISQQGFDRSDANTAAVPETIQSWHALMIGMRRLFAAAGLERSVAVLTGAKIARSLSVDSGTASPRLPR